MEKIKKNLGDYWQIVVAIALVLFNVGYTLAVLEAKPSKEEVKKEIEVAIEKYKIEQKDQYVKIDKVPGLMEMLNAMTKSLRDIEKRIERIENKIYK